MALISREEIVVPMIDEIQVEYGIEKSITEYGAVKERLSSTWVTAGSTEVSYTRMHAIPAETFRSMYLNARIPCATQSIEDHTDISLLSSRHSVAV